MINSKIKEYVEANILPRYDASDKGHGISHVEYVIGRSLKFAEQVPEVNLDMVYVIASYHDVGHSIDAKNHEKVSADMLMADEALREWFSEEEINIMSEAVVDHRASLEYEPRSIYGRIVSSADRNTDLEAPFIRTYEYRVKHGNNNSIDEIMEESYNHLVDKFGNKGYAKEKMYFEDVQYKTFLEELGRILADREEFNKRFIEINKIKQYVKKN